jgi:phosphatidylserine/phosphatidylglycerophosphate/cardiolipin synthase-like enzyme
MAEFLTTNKTSSSIEDIIMDAKNKIVLVSPYLQISKTFYERLKDASNKNVSIKIIYGKDELKTNEKLQLAELKNLELFYFQNLHAKCYLNENKMVITSMNMYEFSEKTNREMGVLIDREKDKELFEKAIAEVKSILESAQNIPLHKSSKLLEIKIVENKKTDIKSKFDNNPKGYCIRCEYRIDFNPNSPYCSSCFSTWVQFENPQYIENVCHMCGKYSDTSMEKPVDYACYKKLTK